MIKILLAEDFEILRQSLKALLDKIDLVSVVADVGDGKAAVEVCQSQLVDIVLLDVQMPEMDGIEVARFLKTNHPHIKIIILTMHDEYEFIKPLFELGVDGYLLKNTDQNELLKAISIVNAGGNYYTPESKDKYIQGGAKAEKQRQEISARDLSKREIQIIKMIAEGLSTDDMSDQLNLSTHTISSHRKNIYRKTGFKNPVDVTRFAIKIGLISIVKDQ
jgi:DNA-binding NarL/FixJ family response regulator